MPERLLVKTGYDAYNPLLVFEGRLAQRESTAFTRQGSLVQIQYRPPFISNRYPCFSRLSS